MSFFYNTNAVLLVRMGLQMQSDLCLDLHKLWWSIKAADVLLRESKAARSHAREQVEKNARIKRSGTSLGISSTALVCSLPIVTKFTPTFLREG